MERNLKEQNITRSGCHYWPGETYFFLLLACESRTLRKRIVFLDGTCELFSVMMIPLKYMYPIAHSRLVFNNFKKLSQCLKETSTIGVYSQFPKIWRKYFIWLAGLFK